MSFNEIANSTLLWVCVSVGLIIVAALTLFYLVKCYRSALEMGVDRKVLKDVVRSTVSFSIIPSIAIVAGLVTLTVVIGLPYAWFRLSVIGSVAYEVMSANMALNALGMTSTADADGYAFGLMAFAMCSGITLSLIFNVFFNKKIHLGTLNMGGGDQKWSAVAQTVFMSALLVALIVPMIFGGLPSLLTFVSSALIAVIVAVIARKTGAKWLNDFVLVFSMTGAMVLSVFWDKLFA